MREESKRRVVASMDMMCVCTFQGRSGVNINK